MATDPHVVERVLITIDRLVLNAKSNEELAVIGAGHLEDVLAAPNGADFVRLFVNRARQDPKWRYALGCVWTKDFTDQAIAKQVEACLNLLFPNGRP